MYKRLLLRGVRGLAITLTLLVISLCLAQTTEELTNPAPENWPTFGRTLDDQRYSPLDQINRENVKSVGLAWSRDLNFEGSVQITPVVYDGVMYINGNDGIVLALDATDGSTVWEYTAGDLAEGTASFFLSRNRGSVVVYEGKVYYAR